MKIVLLIVGLFILAVVWDYSPKLGGILVVILALGLLMGARQKGLL